MIEKFPTCDTYRYHPELLEGKEKVPVYCTECQKFVGYFKPSDATNFYRTQCSTFCIDLVKGFSTDPMEDNRLWIDEDYS